MNLSNLDSKQLHVLDQFKRGKNIFMTGPAGTGKSYLIKIIKKCCETMGKNYQVTALTGCASLLLDCNAKTLHSWAGVGIGNGDLDLILRRIRRKKGVSKRWKNIDVLIIDEVSMMSKKLFEILDYVAKNIRRDLDPFGGIQIIFSGDFYQLPPVGDSSTDEGKFCFESNLWEMTFPNIIELTKIYRQDDPTFSKILNQIRVGRIKKSSIRILQSRIKDFPVSDIKPTILLPRKREVDSINMREHLLLPIKGSKKYSLEITRPKTSKMTELGLNDNIIQSEIDFYTKNSKLSEHMDFKIGDQVMCTSNLDENIVNGSRGVVIENKEGPVVRFINGIELEMRPHGWEHEQISGLHFKQIPLMYAWALTIHKCQGATLDFCVMDIGKNIFACGQTYVALSRVKNIDGLYLTGFDPYKIMINKQVKEFYQKHTNKNLVKEEMITNNNINNQNLLNWVNYSVSKSDDAEKKRKELEKLLIKNKEVSKKVLRNKSSTKNTKSDIPIFFGDREAILDDILYNKLKLFRSKLAKEKNIPPYCIFHNKVLNSLSTYKPKNKNEMEQIKGVGKTFIDVYSEQVLNFILEK